MAAGAADARCTSLGLPMAQHLDIVRGIGIAAIAVAAVLGVVLSPSVAFAKPDEDARRALVLFDRGKIAYKEGRFDESVLLLKEAYAIKAEPVLLYNIGRAHEAKGQLAEAVTAYERYLGSAPGAPDRLEVEGRIAALNAKIAEAAQAAEATAQAAAEADRKARADRERAAEPRVEVVDESGPNLVPWVIAGSGAVVMGVGAVVGVLALGKNSDAEDAPSQRDAVDQQDGAETLALVSTITLIVGGAALAGGATWGIIDLTSASSERTGRVQLRVTGPGASLQGDF